MPHLAVWEAASGRGVVIVGRELALRDASEFEGEEPGTDGALRGAGTLVAQSADIASLCSVALDSAVRGRGDDFRGIAAAASKLMAKCSRDLDAAMGLMD